MFEYLFRMFFKELGKTHIGVLDISTSAVSGALAVRYEKGTAEAYHIAKTFKRPVSLVGEHFENERRIPYVLKEGVLKILKDMHGIYTHLDVVVVNFSDPFFSDLKLEKKVYRQDPKVKISAEEVAALFKNLESEASSHLSSLAVAGRDILGSKINGYDVALPAGYKGKSLEIAAVFTFLNLAFKTDIEDAKDKFFPRAKIEFVSDSRIAQYISKKTKFLDVPALLLSIDGEATGVYLISSDNVQHVGLASFGFRTLERRIAAFLKVSAEEAESVVLRYRQDALEAGIKEKLEKNIIPAMEDWWLKVVSALKNLGDAGFPAKVLVAGRDGPANIFTAFLKENFKARMGFAAELQQFSLAPLAELFHPPSSISQDHAVLLAPLLYPVNP